jgi:N-carbamoylputrescine amidase
MTTAKIAYVEWPEGLLPGGHAWDAVRRSLDAVRPDILVTNEMPFGPWLAEHEKFDAEAAHRSVALHEEAEHALGDLNAAAVLSSRPVLFDGRLANEAFVLESKAYRAVHHKKYFPQGAGFFEETWYSTGAGGFECVKIGQVMVGVLLCTELFFNERARAYGRAGADLIVTPRASGPMLSRWKTAGAMAAIVSGAWFVSSNRTGAGALGQRFGGTGFAMSPDGGLRGETSEASPLAVVTIDLDAARAQKSEYPCYVKELGE